MSILHNIVLFGLFCPAAALCADGAMMVPVLEVCSVQTEKGIYDRSLSPAAALAVIGDAILATSQAVAEIEAEIKLFKSECQATQKCKNPQPLFERKYCFVGQMNQLENAQGFWNDLTDTNIEVFEEEIASAGRSLASE
jgi:hypothetical protein